MLRRIKFKKIREISEELKKEILELKSENDILKEDVLKIREYYQGEDAELIISKFESRINYIEEYINILEVYNNYFEWISGAYEATNQKALKNLENLITDVVNNLDTLNIEIEGENND